MAELNPEEKTKREDATIGMTEDGEVCVCTLPLKKYADDEVNGAALLHGKFRELEAHARQQFLVMKQRKAQAGLVRVNGAPPPDLKVN